MYYINDGTDVLRNRMKKLIDTCISTNGIKKKSLINFINTSTQSLIQNEKERLKTIENYINECIENKYLIIIGEDMYYLNNKDTEGTNVLKDRMTELMHKCIPVSGIKRKSLVNFLNTSIHSLIQDKDQRIKTIEEYIDKCIENKELVIKMDKINFNNGTDNIGEDTNVLELRMKELMKKCIPEKGIKRQSLINFINTSINSSIQNSEQRLKLIKNYIDKCIDDKYLVVLESGKINFN